MKTKLAILIAILAFASLYAADTLYSVMSDKSDEFSQNQSNVFSPGYINATKQHTDEIIRQENKPKTLMESAMEYVKNKLSNRVAEGANDEVTPELKKKTGKGESPKATSQAIETTEVITAIQEAITDISENVDFSDHAPSNVKIGSGTNQWYYLKRTIRGRIVYQPVTTPTDMLVTEVINGTRYWYLGFNDFGAQNLNILLGTSFRSVDFKPLMKAGDIILVKSGSTIDITTSVGRTLNGYNIYGGYLADGTRDTSGSRSVLSYTNQSISYASTVISGLEVRSTGNITLGSNVTAINCKFSEEISVKENSSNIRLKDNIFEKNLTIQDNTSGIIALGNQFSGLTMNEGSQIFLKDNKFSGDVYAYGRWRNYVGSYPMYYGVYESTDDPMVDILVRSYYAGMSDPYVDSGGVYSQITSVNNEFGNGSKINLYGSQITSQNDHYAGGITFNGMIGDELSNIFIRNISNQLDNQNTSSTVLLTSKDMFSTQRDYMLSHSLIFNLSLGKNLDGATLVNMFKGLLNNKDAIMAQGQAGWPIDSAFMEKLLVNMTDKSAFSIPAVNADTNSAQMEAAMILANILKNPTEDQRMMLEAVTALMAAVDAINAQNDNPDLKKAEDNLLQAVASILLAQAIPDLLKEGDVSNIKNIFAELNTDKGKIMLEYQLSTKPYYDNIVKELSRNIQLLQLKDVLSKNMTQQELEKLSRSELDKIMEKLRSASDKSFEEEYMIQQEAKYRKAYIDPSKKALEDSLKKMLDGFTKRLSGVLEGVKRTEKK